MLRNHYFSIFLGLVSSLLLWGAFPGGGEVWQLMGIALVPLFSGIMLVRNGRQAALVCFLAGLVHYHLLMYWIVHVLGQYGGLGWFLSSQALLFLATYMSLYFAVFGFLAKRVLSRDRRIFALFILPALWVALEWLKGVLFTGLPWMDLGYSLFQVPLLIQSADIFGHLGISYLIVLVNVYFVLVLEPGQEFVARFFMTLVVAALLFSVGIYSKVRYQDITELAGNGQEQLRAGVVQGNIDQNMKWSQDMQRTTVDKYLRLTRQLAESDNPPDIVVWPETALPFYPTDNPYMTQIRGELAKENITVLTGAPMYEVVSLEKKTVKFFNSALLLDSTTLEEKRYDKSHLVPFGEYVPLKEFLPFLEPFVETVGDFTAGEIVEPLTAGNARIGVLICFESVFPELSRKWVEQGANVLVNLTNDAWYGKSSAPHNSLAMAVLRSVEVRRSVIRCANTGISAFISPLGEVANESDLFVDWAGSSQTALISTRTFWVQWGRYFGPLCVLVLCATVLYIIRYGKRE